MSPHVVRATHPQRAVFTPKAAKANRTKGQAVLGTVLLIIIILLLVGAVPRWPYSANWGYGPSGVLGAVLVVVLILLLLGQL